MGKLVFKITPDGKTELIVDDTSVTQEEEFEIMQAIAGGMGKEVGRKPTGNAPHEHKHARKHVARDRGVDWR